jgi:hypothetical protein
VSKGTHEDSEMTVSLSLLSNFSMETNKTGDGFLSPWHIPHNCNRRRCRHEPRAAAPRI